MKFSKREFIRISNLTFSEILDLKERVIKNRRIPDLRLYLGFAVYEGLKQIEKLTYTNFCNALKLIDKVEME